MILMRRKDNNEFEDLDDYYEDDEVFYNQTIERDLSDVRYEDFNKAEEIIIEDEDDDDDDDAIKQTTTKKKTSVETRLIENEGLMEGLSIFWLWFRRIGIVIAVILVAYYITKGLFKDLLMYILLLVVSFFFGFGFMAILTRVMDNR